MKGNTLIHGYHYPAHFMRREKVLFFFSLILCFGMLIALPGQISFTAAVSPGQETRDHPVLPPINEVYYLSWPEDQMMTAFGSIFQSGATSPGDNTCPVAGTNAPAEPVISYSSISISESGTVVFYDHYEDGYEMVLNSPIQTTTEIWGDGDLTNGVAPGDADDLLDAGQILILRSVKNSTTTPDTTYDYDGRDKIGVGLRASVTRSSWATGSATNFVAGDQLSPTSQWGTSYIIPIGEAPGYNDHFQYTGAVAMAMEDGTTVYFDRDGDGVAPQLTCNLDEGDSCLWDDASFTTGIMGVHNVIGNGLIPGSTIWSDKPIQVHLLTGNVCSYYESRSYTLVPVSKWSDRYGNPVSTGNGSDGLPAHTTVHLFNPDPINDIYIAYQCYGGSPNTLTAPVILTVPAYSGIHHIQPDDTGCRYYSVNVSGTIYNVHDTFATQSFSRQDGSANWATNWIEANDGTASQDPDGGDVRIENGELRIGQDDNSSIYRTANLSGAQWATLTFTFRETGSTTGDELTIQARRTSASSWIDIGTINGIQTLGSRSYDLSPYLSATSAIRFIITDAWEDGEFVYLDDVDIRYASALVETSRSYKDFSALASVGTDGAGSSFDWGYSMVPFGNVSPWLVVGYAPGMDPEYTGTDTQNSAPIWVLGSHEDDTNDTSSFTICVDYDGDDAAGIIDPITLKYYDTTYTISPLQQQIIYDPDGDQTGMQIWVCGYDVAVGSDVVLTAAWGQDPTTATTGSPAVDMGFSIRNMRAWTALKGVVFAPGGDLGEVDAYNEGDTVRYTITVPNSGAIIAANTLNVNDALPPEVEYVANTTYYEDHLGMTTAIPDSVNGTPFPLDDDGFIYPLALPATESFKVFFDATIKVNGIIFPYGILNIATVTDAFYTENPEAEIAVNNEPTAIDIPSNPDSVLSNAIHVTWETASELQLVGFKLYREVNHAGVLSQLSIINAYTPDMIIGNDYEYIDTDYLAGNTYTYWVEVLWKNGTTLMLEPTSVMVPFTMYLPMIAQ